MDVFLRLGKVMPLACLLVSAIAAAEPTTFRDVVVHMASDVPEVQKRVGGLFVDRLAEILDTEVRVQSGAHSPRNEDAETLHILIGTVDTNPDLAAWFDANRVKPLTWLDPGLEGYLVHFDSAADSKLLIAAGHDDRGTLYAVGEILRQAVLTPNSITLPGQLNTRTAPAFEIRGTQYGQSHIAKSKANVRNWTDAETQRCILDYALAGANIFSTDAGPMFDFIKSYGLMTQGDFGANTGSGPPEWEAKESIGRTGYVCLSVPEAVQAQVKRCEDHFKNGPTFDLVKFQGGDGGGCECDRCDPYGLTFIKVVEQMASAIHKYHPETRVYFTNQKFDDADDQAIFKYLQEEPREWLWAWGYGPGSDAMSWQPGHRQTHAMDLFRYPGYGPFDRYNQEIVHQLPPQQVLVHYNEITHWRYSQHGYIQMYPRADRNGDLPPPWNHWIYERRPDQALTMVYDRLTFYAWPKFYHWLFGEVNRYGVGDITHSSGHHDHFNQWMWQRLLWNPHMSVEAVVDEYCRTWFGPEAAPYMAKAIFQLEENLEEDPETPIGDKSGIDEYYALVKEAGERIPAHHMKTNWIWREYMQKGALDWYIKRDVQQQVALQERIELRTAKILESGNAEKSISEMLSWFDELEETPEMAALREEAGRLGEESNALYGVRSEGYFNLEHDFIGLGWLKRQLERARDTNGEERNELLRMIVAYEDPGEGGFYDNLGTANPAPNVEFGYPYDHGQPYVDGMLDEGNRPSQRSMHFTQNEDQGVTLEYRGLDPDATYRVRFTLVRPWFQDRYAHRMNQKSESIYADDILLVRELELPYMMSDFFTFDIPREATQDGKVVIRFEKAHDVATGDRVTVEQWRNSGGWGTLLSEAWLMKSND
ncbi:MAG: hypothetical protein KJ060_03545 [Candidatus Hydrogenedentes bacterium]|nr:hypothetical protein [Candidatus Hydrogenedentota bacterium]